MKKENLRKWSEVLYQFSLKDCRRSNDKQHDLTTGQFVVFDLTLIVVTKLTPANLYYWPLKWLFYLILVEVFLKGEIYSSHDYV